MSEEWRDIPTWPNYQASSLGRIRSAYRGGRILKPSASGKYLSLTLCRDKTHYCCLVHRLVALAFRGLPPDPKSHARHLNDDGHDNREANIAWGTAKQNAADADRNGLARRGEVHGGTNLTAFDAYSICCRAAAGESRKAIADGFGLNVSAVSHIVHGRNWRRSILEAGYDPPIIRKRVSRRLTEPMVRKIVKMHKAGATLNEIATATGVPKGTVSPLVGGHEARWSHLVSDLKPRVARKRFSEKEVRKMAKRRSEGASYQSIADEIGAGLVSVYRILNGKRKSYSELLPS